MSLIRFAVTCAAAFFLFQAPAHAQQNDTSIGVVAETEGAVTITHENAAPTAAAISMPVYLNDKIETAAGAKAHILFDDETEVTLAENASLTVDEYVYDPDDDTASKGRFGLMRGAFIFVSGLINKTKNPDVELEVAYGSIGMRGTTVWGGETDGQYGVFVADGAASVKTDRGLVRLAKGEGTDLFGRSKAPGKVKTWGEARIAKATGTVALQRREEVRQRVTQMKEQRREIRAQRKMLSAPLSKERQETQQENRDDRKENLQHRMEERKENLQELKNTPPEKRGELRDDRQQDRQDMRGNTQDTRQTIRDNRQDTRQNIQDTRQDTRQQLQPQQRQQVQPQQQQRQQLQQQQRAAPSRNVNPAPRMPAAPRVPTNR